MGSAQLASGEHSVMMDGKTSLGQPLASGIYFYSIDGPDGAQNGRLVIAR